VLKEGHQNDENGEIEPHLCSQLTNSNREGINCSVADLEREAHGSAAHSWKRNIVIS
jgi:hypothetical protein